MPPLLAPRKAGLSIFLSPRQQLPPQSRTITSRPLTTATTSQHPNTPIPTHHPAKPSPLLRHRRENPSLSHNSRPFSSTCPRSLAAPTPPAPTPLTPEKYHTLSDAYIDALVTQLEELQEQREDVDVEYSAGVLTLTLPPHGTYVLNKQPPNKQIWLSSPVSGPKRYDWVEGEWVYLRDGSTLGGLLGVEMGVKMGGGEGD